MAYFPCIICVESNAIKSIKSNSKYRYKHLKSFKELPLRIHKLLLSTFPYPIGISEGLPWVPWIDLCHDGLYRFSGSNIDSFLGGLHPRKQKVCWNQIRATRGLGRLSQSSLGQELPNAQNRVAWSVFVVQHSGQFL